ncbi:MAG: GspE/PulE family protein [Caulobacterales bacterium]|uniref:GspE/PulE family protein n=1 Tax=Glycocaulis sp. TaxID=1969725 RepID=UPI003F9F44BF
MDHRRIGEILLEDGALTQRDVDAALRFQEEVGGLFGQALMRLGAVSEEVLLAALSRQLDLAILAAHQLPNEAAAYLEAGARLNLSLRWLLAHECVIWFESPDGAGAGGADILHIFTRDPLSAPLREALERVWDGASVYYLGSNRLLDSALALARSEGAADEWMGDDAARLRELAEEAPVIDFVNGVFEDALRQRASDIHVEPFEHHFQIRFRIDGVLREVQTLPRARFDAVASRIKLLSAMDIAERRLPQDGRQSVRFAGQDIDLRVSSLPGAWGESLVLRLLRKQQSLPSLEGLGLTGRSMEVFRDLLEERNGVILVTGPTGSGKSTTLYRGLELVNDGARKIITIEDPVEYDIDGVTQVQARADIGYTFARGLRAILRQDPDIIMIGEIRDGETAAIATQAALTGHLVFSTLHTNSALSAVERLVDLGIEPFLVSASLRGLMGQRLVRQVCPHCAKPADIESRLEGERRLNAARAAGARLPVDMGAANWVEAEGCHHCADQGYLGRIAVYEVARLTGAMREAVNNRATEADLLSAARQDGYITMYEDALAKAALGRTTLSEVLRVFGAAAHTRAPVRASAE